MLQLKKADLLTMFSEVMAEKMKELGLTDVDRNHGMFPGVEGGDDPAIGKEARIEKFARAILQMDHTVLKALSEGTDSAGGYLVPDEFHAEIIQRLPELSELAAYVRVVPVGGDAGTFPTLATDVSISWDESENEAFDESNPVFGNKTFTIHRLNAITKTSRELVSDSKIKLAPYLTQLFAEAVAAERDKVIAIGNGTDRPQGIYSASGLSSVASIGTLAFTDLVEIEHTLAKKYRKGARWIMSNGNVQRVRSFKDSDNRPIFIRDLQTGQPPRLLGYPISQQDDLPDSRIYFGDLKRYFWFDREKMAVESTTIGGDAFEKHQLWIKLWERCDGKVMLAEGFVYGAGITG